MSSRRTQPVQLDVLWGRARYAFELLLERRLVLILCLDGLILVGGLIEAWVAGGSPSGLYRQVVLIPYLVLALPTMAGVVALERRAGSLDLALTVPSTAAYFVRRLAPVCALFVLQGWLVMALALPRWDAALARAMLQSLVTVALLAAITLFWAVRLQTTGAVLTASLGCAAVLGPWIFSSPFESTVLGMVPTFLGIPEPVLAWMGSFLVLVLATLIFALYALARLRRPETLLT